MVSALVMAAVRIFCQLGILSLSRHPSQAWEALKNQHFQQGHITLHHRRIWTQHRTSTDNMSRSRLSEWVSPNLTHSNERYTDMTDRVLLGRWGEQSDWAMGASKKQQRRLARV